jgi:glycosyltransferase involved in cell wall biosynthesis
VLGQSFGDFEAIVVDDASTDGTADVLTALGDVRIRVLRLADNGGVSRARNAAIAVARGDWVAFLDDDNEWAPTYLERQLALAASRPLAEVVYCRVQRHSDRTGRDMAVVPAAIPQGQVFRHLADRWLPPVSCTMVRRERLVAVGGFDEGLRVAEDLDLWLRLAQQVDFAGTAEVLAVRHEDVGGQLSTRSELYGDAIASLDRRWGPVIEARCGRMVRRRWRAGLLEHQDAMRARRALRAGRRLEAAWCGLRLVRLLPWTISYLAGPARRRDLHSGLR